MIPNTYVGRSINLFVLTINIMSTCMIISASVQIGQLRLLSIQGIDSSGPHGVDSSSNNYLIFKFYAAGPPVIWRISNIYTTI